MSSNLFCIILRVKPGRLRGSNPNVITATGNLYGLCELRISKKITRHLQLEYLPHTFFGKMSANRQEYPSVLDALMSQNLGFWLDSSKSINPTLNLYFPKMEESRKIKYSDDPDLGSEYERKAVMRQQLLKQNNKAAKDTNFKKNMVNMGFKIIRNREKIKFVYVS